MKLEMHKLSPEFSVCLLPSQVYQHLEPIMVEKVLIDIDNEVS